MTDENRASDEPLPWPGIEHDSLGERAAERYANLGLGQSEWPWEDAGEFLAIASVELECAKASAEWGDELSATKHMAMAHNHMLFAYGIINDYHVSKDEYDARSDADE